ncbi:MAG: hypothetical protein EU549_01310, partial [Promethearchaeota archaeon]
MCEYCLKHGAGKKWYLNAQNYKLDQLGESEEDMVNYLEEQWMQFETVFIRKIMGFSSKDLGYKMKMPI